MRFEVWTYGMRYATGSLEIMCKMLVGANWFLTRNSKTVLRAIIYCFIVTVLQSSEYSCVPVYGQNGKFVQQLHTIG